MTEAPGSEIHNDGAIRQDHLIEQPVEHFGIEAVGKLLCCVPIVALHKRVIEK